MNVDEPGLREHLQMLGDGLLADVEVLADLVYRVRLVAHQPQDRLPAWLGQRAEDGLFAHAVHYSRRTIGAPVDTCTSIHLYESARRSIDPQGGPHERPQSAERRPR